MGKKNRKSQDDGDYFASLGAPTEDKIDDAAAERAEEARLAQQAKAAAAREAKKQKDAQERAAREATAERPRLAMERRSTRGPAAAEEKEEEVAAAPAPPTAPPAAEEETPLPPALSPFAKVLLFLRPYSPDVGAVSGLGAVWRFLWVLLSKFAAPDLIEAVDANLRSTNSIAAEQIDAEDERKRTTMLFCPESGTWLPRNTKVWSLQSLRRTDTVIERWVKNLKTKGKSELWTRVRDGDGWASCPAKLGTADDELGDAEVQFYACLDDKVFECTDWIGSHLCTRAAARELGCVDGPRALFRVVFDEVQGAVATLDKKAAATLHAKADTTTTKKAPKEKMSRAEKKAKKKSYGR